MHKVPGSFVRSAFTLLGVTCGLLLSASSSTGAPDPHHQCLTRCGVQYQFCMKSATTKRAQQACKAARKPCKQGCVATSFPTGKSVQ